MKTKIVKKPVQRKPKPIYTPEQKQISEIMDSLRDLDREVFDLTSDDISLTQIASICVDVWGCSMSVITEKTNHKDHWQKLQKESFFYAAYYFSNSSENEVLNFASYKGSELFKRSKY